MRLMFSEAIFENLILGDLGAISKLIRNLIPQPPHSYSSTPLPHISTKLSFVVMFLPDVMRNND